jgi:E2F transcription factor CC-MB domain/E2F/DP family winged-helix DNA-binding domain
MGSWGSMGRLSPSDDSLRGSGARLETSLGVLTQKFVEMLKTSAEGTVDLNDAARHLQVQKRRLYDVTNVKDTKNQVKWVDNPDNDLSRANVVYFPPIDTSQIEPVKKQVDALRAEGKQLDQYIEYLAKQASLYPLERKPPPVSNRSTARLTYLPPGVTDAHPYMHIRYSDLTEMDMYKEENVIAMRVPKGTTLDVPDCDQGMKPGERRFQMFLSSQKPGKGTKKEGVEGGPIDVFLVKPLVLPEEETSSKKDDSEEKVSAKQGTKPESKQSRKAKTKPEPEKKAPAKQAPNKPPLKKSPAMGGYVQDSFGDSPTPHSPPEQKRIPYNYAPIPPYYHYPPYAYDLAPKQPYRAAPEYGAPYPTSYHYPGPSWGPPHHRHPSQPYPVMDPYGRPTLPPAAQVEATPKRRKTDRVGEVTGSPKQPGASHQARRREESFSPVALKPRSSPSPLPEEDEGAFYPFDTDHLDTSDIPPIPPTPTGSWGRMYYPNYASETPARMTRGGPSAAGMSIASANSFEVSRPLSPLQSDLYHMPLQSPSSRGLLPSNFMLSPAGTTLPSMNFLSPTAHFPLPSLHGTDEHQWPPSEEDEEDHKYSSDVPPRR